MSMASRGDYVFTSNKNNVRHGAITNTARMEFSHQNSKLIRLLRSRFRMGFAI